MIFAGGKAEANISNKKGPVRSERVTWCRRGVSISVPSDITAIPLTDVQRKLLK